MTKTTATTKTKTKTWKKCLCNPHVWGLVARVRTTAERAHCRAAQEHRRPNPTPCGCPMTMCIFCIQTDMSTCLCQSTVELNHATTSSTAINILQTPRCFSVYHVVPPVGSNLRHLRRDWCSSLLSRNQHLQLRYQA